MDLDYIHMAFSTVRICKLFDTFGKLNDILYRYPVDADVFWEVAITALDAIGEILYRYNTDYGYKYYYSDSAMVEYYRLCREYSRKIGVRLKDNPYMVNAESFVENMLHSHNYGYDWRLHTGVRHRWASGIVIYIDESFNEYMELVEALLEIFDYYRKNAEKLREELKQTGEEASAA